MEDFQMRHRRRLRHDYTTTPNVLLYGYEGMSDGARITYQVVDSFDWPDAGGLRKGFAYPSTQTVANIRGVDKKTVIRHYQELERRGLLTREERPGRTSILVIEDPSEEEVEKYLARFGRGGEDKNVQGTLDKNVHPYKKQAKTEEFKPVNEDKPIPKEGSGPEPLKAILSRHAFDIRPKHPVSGNTNAKHEYLAQQMLGVLGDKHSLGYYRKEAARTQSQLIFESLALVKEAKQDGRITRNKGALFVTILKAKRAKNQASSSMK